MKKLFRHMMVLGGAIVIVWTTLNWESITEVWENISDNWEG